MNRIQACHLAIGLLERNQPIGTDILAAIDPGARELCRRRRHSALRPVSDRQRLIAIFQLTEIIAAAVSETAA